MSNMRPRNRNRILAGLAIVVALLVVGGIAIVTLAPRILATAPTADPPPGPDYALPAAPPVTATKATRKGVAGRVDADWLARVSAESGIPERALAAYAGAAIAKAKSMPSCGLNWTTLAAIGLIESDHGQHGGSSIDDDGTVSPPIFGIALDGSASSNIPDSDGGKFDGDSTYDRAVGPMQLIPQTWRNWHVDGNGDGVEDPQNIDDAVVATSNYLCRASGDMVSRGGWRAGILAFNGSDFYAQSVANAANRYAADAAAVTRG
jgi:membrane-bound lytic murein transglycosylase B